MLNLITDIIDAGANSVQSLGAEVDRIIKTSLRGRYVQRDGESDEAYRLRLDFLQEREARREQAKLRKQELRAETKATRLEARTLIRQDREKTRLKRQELRAETRQRGNAE